MGQPLIPFQRRAGVDLPSVREQLERCGAQLVQAAIMADAGERLRLLGRAGEAYYLLGDYSVALPLLEEAVRLAQAARDGRLEVANLLRLATAYQYVEQHHRAEPLFRRALALARTAGQTDLLDFALQHFGKCLVEMGWLAEAITCFGEALALRRAKSDEGLIASTERALAAVRRR